MYIHTYILICMYTYIHSYIHRQIKSQRKVHRDIQTESIRNLPLMWHGAISIDF